MYFVGIDVAKDHHDVTVLDATGKVVLSGFRFANSQAGLASLCAQLAPFTPLQLALEATGHYWLPLYEALVARGYTVAVFNPLQIKAYRQVGLRQTKTDQVDSYWIADFLRIGRCPPPPVPTPQVRQLREVARLRFFLLQQQSNVQRRALTILDRVFPEYLTLFSRPFSHTSRALLRQAVTAEAFARWPLEELTHFIHQASRGHLKPTLAQQLHQLAHNSLGIRSLETVAFHAMQYLLDQWELLESQLATLEATLAHLLAQTNTYLTTIPGLGPTLAATILGEIGDIQRFTRLSQLIAYAGLDPSVHQSGQFQATHTHLSKRGSVYLRRAVWLAAQIACLHDPELRALYARKRSQHKHHGVAMGAVCHRLLARIYVVLKEHRPYIVRDKPANT